MILKLIKTALCDQVAKNSTVFIFLLTNLHHYGSLFPTHFLWTYILIILHVTNDFIILFSRGRIER